MLSVTDVTNTLKRLEMRTKRIVHRSIPLLVICALVGMSPGTAGDTKLTKKDVPAAVLESFKQSYPNATVKGYGKEVENGKTFYELETVDGTTRRDLLYTPEGKVAEIEEAVAMKDLPDPVAKAFAKESPKAKAVKIEKTTHGDKVQYDFHMGKGRSALVIGPTGIVLKHSTAVNAEKSED
jgi:hypothetical protein